MKRGPNRRSLDRTIRALREFGVDGATVDELRHALDLGRPGRGHPGPGPWLDQLARDGRVTVIPNTQPTRYRVRAATDREVTAALHRDAARAIARAKQLQRVVAERDRRAR